MIEYRMVRTKHINIARPVHFNKEGKVDRLDGFSLLDITDDLNQIYHWHGYICPLATIRTLNNITKKDVI